MFVFVVQFIPFSHKKSDFSVYPRLSVLYFLLFCVGRTYLWLFPVQM